MSEKRTPTSVPWYRSPLPPGEFKKLHTRSDWKGAAQTLSYLALLGLTGTLAFLAARRGAIPATVAFVFLHGMVASFLINGVHELGHGTVFKTPLLNAFFVRVLSFIGWINFGMFQESHARHHRYTLHTPDDLEVVLPMRLMVRDFFRQGFVNLFAIRNAARNTWRTACGRFEGEWEETLYPEDEPERRRSVVRWARFLIVGHGAILAFSLWQHLWFLPVVTSLAPYCGGWLFFLCNNTQHIGLQDNTSDFRLSCRTFTVNPVIQFLYWHMNYHTEHHMYAAVPCYNLGRLHRLIVHDLPPCPHGLAATWREIAHIQKLQDADPSYRHSIPLPSAT